MKLGKKLVKNIVFVSACAVFAGTGLSAFAASDSGKSSVDRYAVYVASNRGGEKRENLRYAGSDAVKLAKTLAEVGGVSDDNSFVLVDPAKDEIDEILNAVSVKIQSRKTGTKRTEFIFYYSGHSDENALLLGDEQYDYGLLKNAISNVPSDVHVVMLDSCFSGNFIRAKGGSRQKAFLVDDSTVVQGHAYLSSSSESESSQESDALRASYFTHAMVTGLRGAADTSGDNKVSLNELYYYAFNETLSKTELSSIGPQHPSYNITMVGSGDLVLTDISSAESVLVIPVETEGKYFIRTIDGVLASEINKIKGNKVSLALSEGYYTVTIVTPGQTDQANIRIVRGQEYVLSDNQFSRLSRVPGRARGNSSGDTDTNSVQNVTISPIINVNPVIGGATVAAGAGAAANAITAADVAGSTVTGTAAAPADDALKQLDAELEAIKQDALRRAREISGETAQKAAPVDAEPQESAALAIPAAALSDADGFLAGFPGDNADWRGFYLELVPGVDFGSSKPDNVRTSLKFIGSDKYVYGIQASALYGEVKQSVRGIQASGLINSVGRDMAGVQGAGLINIVGREIRGAQGAGLMNIAGTVSGVQGAGLMNIADSMDGVQGAGLMNITDSIDGMQGAGFMNIAGNVSGIQAAGFMNIAGNVKGAQVGVINFAQKNTGVTVGLLNFVVDGIISPGITVDTTGAVCFQYQGGTNKLFTTLIGGGSDPDTPLIIAGVGLGTRAEIGKVFSVDLEVLFRQIVERDKVQNWWESSTTKTKVEADKTVAGSDVEKDAESFYNDCDPWYIPGLRVTGNIALFKHLVLFASVNADVGIDGFNDRYFDKVSSAWSFSIGSDVDVHTTFSFGIKF